MSEILRVVGLFSGRASTLEHLILATRPGGALHGRVEIVGGICSNATTAGIERILSHGVPVSIVSYKRDMSTFGPRLLEALAPVRPDVVGMYGFLPPLPPEVIEAYPNRMINQHGGPLDPGHRNAVGERLDFGGYGMHGRRIHAAVLLFARSISRDFPSTEATAQRVSLEYDGGAVLRRRAVPILATDAPEDLAARVLPVEHALQVETLADFANGTVAEASPREPLVHRSESCFVWNAKLYAAKLYPRG